MLVLLWLLVLVVLLLLVLVSLLSLLVFDLLLGVFFEADSGRRLGGVRPAVCGIV
jgi:hypothetical protein